MGALSESLLLMSDSKVIHLVTPAGYILSTNHTRWRSGAGAVTTDELAPAYRIDLHDGLSITTYYCPASGTLLWVDIHEPGQQPEDDVVLQLESTVSP